MVINERVSDFKKRNSFNIYFVIIISFSLVIKG